MLIAREVERTTSAAAAHHALQMEFTASSEANQHLENTSLERHYGRSQGVVEGAGCEGEKAHLDERSNDDW